MGTDIGLYIHIPFCKSKCKYCDFLSWAGMDESIIDEYFNCLEKEILLYAVKFKKESRKIYSVFIGGGTPTSVNVKYIVSILNLIYSNFDVVCNAEITLEANPGTVDSTSLSIYKEAGINRISFGLQAWQNNLLQLLGRIHTREQFIKSYEEARNVGFNNLNIDIIFGIPGQTMNDFDECLNGIITLKPEHLSAYSLIVEEGTELSKMIENKQLIPIDDELDRRMNSYLIEFLNHNGYEHYEISNFCKPGMESKHNLIYWNCTDYLGLGLASHSFIDGNRFSNPDNFQSYIKKIMNFGNNPNEIYDKFENISKAEQMQEFMMLGFRKLKGPDFNEFYKKFGCTYNIIFDKQIKKLIDEGLIEAYDEHGYRLTVKGLDFANLVFMEFCGD